jgi:hypothetical protein
VELYLFDEVSEVLRGLVPAELGALRLRSQRYGIKVWFDTEKPPREHYEAQVVGARYVPTASTLALEIGFHAEHPKPDDNQAALDTLLAGRTRWRKTLGDGAEAAPFLGRADWRRLSETWADPDLGDPEMSFEIASRLTDYLTALEPLRR